MYASMYNFETATLARETYAAVRNRLLQQMHPILLCMKCISGADRSDRIANLVQPGRDK
jgi:hypothetical protein